MTEGWSGQGTAKPRGLNDKGREYNMLHAQRTTAKGHQLVRWEIQDGPA